MFTGTRITNPVSPVASKGLMAQYAKYVPILDTHPDLVKIIRAWPGLPDDVKKRIVRLASG